ncbi:MULTISPECIES: hypothetical protein [Pseudomonas]|uniref:hypothetical protein n=1 Tax=Pseudomonas TaxID=286 RepID=UPI001D702155|nr:MULTISPECIES: hypothetical protein [Pseudomonas]MBS6035891.1 hypothetical protein [Pseudomonas sp.]MCZ9639597.1 hypothetical protein [Pseudomonas putida]
MKKLLGEPGTPVRYRSTTWFSYGMILLLIAVAALAPIYSIFGSWMAAGEERAIWVQRSGAVATLFAFIAGAMVVFTSGRLHTPGFWGDENRITVLSEFRGRFRFAESAILVLSITGTVIWGYGDLIYKWSIEELELEKLKLLLPTVVWVCSLVSAVSWARSAAANVPAKTPGARLVWTDEDGAQTDLVATAKLQGKWNKIAAIFASIAAGAQAITILMS